MATHYYVRSPVTGRWFFGPNRGSTGRIDVAFKYPEDHPHLESMARAALYGGLKLRLRQVSSSEPTRKQCPECKGTGDSPSMPAFDCFVCDGLGWIDA